MASKAGASKNVGDKSGNEAFLSEIEAINKALFPENKVLSKSLNSTSRPRSISAGKLLLPDSKLKYGGGKDDPSSHKDGSKKSIWNWKPLKAFSTARNQRFNCCFSLQVHSIEGLPKSFNDISLRVNWKRRDASLVTRPAKSFEGSVEFEEKLMHTCSGYGSRSGPHHSAKYEAKHCLLYAEIFGAAEVDLGKHRIDLTRLLPLTLEELEKEEKSSGKWTTSFKLSGKAKGAVLNVSFGYTVVGDSNNNSIREPINMKQNLSVVKTVTKHSQGDIRGPFRRFESLPNTGPSQPVEDIKDLHEVFANSKSELADSIDMLYKKFDEEDKLDTSIDLDKPYSYPVSESSKGSAENKNEESDFSVTEQEIDFSANEPLKSAGAIIVHVPVVETPEVPKGETLSLETFEEGATLVFQDAEDFSFKDGPVIQDCDSKMEGTCSSESLMEELDSVLNSVSNLETEMLDFPEDHENCVEVQTGYETNRMDRSLSFDAVTESVTSEFLTNLRIDHSPVGFSSGSETESPRGRLLRQFEKETLGAGCSLFGFDIEDGEETQYECNFPTESVCEDLSLDFDISSFIQAAEEEHQMATEALNSKMKAKTLEGLETEALMHEWGLNEKAFQCSPPKSASGFGSPINILPEEPLELPPLGEGLGPILRTNNGGFLRSMNPSLFSNAKSGGSLIMQVSSPVVVPAEMGSGVMDILQQLAAAGIEKLSMQANKLMPLDDVTGKTMQQVAWEALLTLDGPESQGYSHHELGAGPDISVEPKKGQGKSSGPRSNKYPTSTNGNLVPEYVSLEDLAPLAMDKIEALSMEGLRIQSGMSENEAPSNISAQSIGDISALQGTGNNVSGSLGLQGTVGLQLLDVKHGGDDIDGLMGLSLTLDEWMRLDSGDISDEDQISERTSKILSEHHAAPLEMIRSKGEKKRSKKKSGLLGNNLTVALMVQLRDPLRNYKPVCTPMLALIQVERVFIPPKPKIYSTVSIVRNNDEEEDGESKSEVKEKIEKEEEEEIVSKDEAIPQFRITEVHVAGLKPEPGKKKPWGSSSQQQSSSRWLLANGMNKSNKHPFMKSEASSKSAKPMMGKPEAPSTTTVQPGDMLWSISSRFNGSGAKWKELAELNPHIRNPNVILPNTKIRLH